MQLAQMTYVNQVVSEVKRLCPILPTIFGKAKETFEFEGRTIPQGWMVMFALRAINTDERSFPDPERFDPERHTDAKTKARDENAFVPHGPGAETGHKCPGTDYATYFMQVFVTLLLRNATVELAPQALEYDWSVTPPEPKSGLRMTVRPR